MVLTDRTNVVALAGGVGGAKLADGLAQALNARQLTIIGNVADDVTLYGLHISPDLDTVMYTLAGLANPETGWGLAGESWEALAMLERYAEPAWFRLGDHDLATHLLRTGWLAEGLSLTAVTERLCRALGVGPRLLPATDDVVRTRLDTLEHGELDFQTYFVRYRWQPTVRRVWYQGIETARASDAVVNALTKADMIVVCPSNPVLSIGPILAVPGVRQALEGRRGVCVAVSPFIGGHAVKGPATKLMGELGLASTPAALLGYYGALIDGLVIDRADQELVPEGERPVLVTSTLMASTDDRLRLAETVLEWASSL